MKKQRQRSRGKKLDLADLTSKKSKVKKPENLLDSVDFTNKMLMQKIKQKEQDNELIKSQTEQILNKFYLQQSSQDQTQNIKRKKLLQTYDDKLQGLKNQHQNMVKDLKNQEQLITLQLKELKKYEIHENNQTFRNMQEILTQIQAKLKEKEEKKILINNKIEVLSNKILNYQESIQYLEKQLIVVNKSEKKELQQYEQDSYYLSNMENHLKEKQYEYKNTNRQLQEIQISIQDQMKLYKETDQNYFSESLSLQQSERQNLAEIKKFEEGLTVYIKEITFISAEQIISFKIYQNFLKQGFNTLKKKFQRQKNQILSIEFIG